MSAAQLVQFFYSIRLDEASSEEDRQSVRSVLEPEKTAAEDMLGRIAAIGGVVM